MTDYFAGKDDLALDHEEAFVWSLAGIVAGRAAGESALAAPHGAFGAAVAGQSPVAGFAGPEFSRTIDESPTLSACLRGLHDRREEALAEALIAAVHRVLFRRIQDLTLAERANP
ncbi:hypothetical protein [Streptomyces sp. NPDC088246]|uniref:hypothetical protein n=1 Tax=Streptomyces sp. NPDC088246 TaxID=3365842 RepID=UPI00381AA932